MVVTIEKTRIDPIKLAMATDPFPDLTFINFLGFRLFVTIFRESVFLTRFVFCSVLLITLKPSSVIGIYPVDNEMNRNERDADEVEKRGDM